MFIEPTVCCPPPVPQLCNPLSNDALDLSKVPSEYHNLREAQTFSPHRPYDCAIDLLRGPQLPTSHRCHLSYPEKEAMENFISECIAAGLIRPSSSPCSAGFFFIKKMKKTQSVCVRPFRLVPTPRDIERSIKDKLAKSYFLQISKSTIQHKKPSKETELVQAFMQRLLRADYTARHLFVKNDSTVPTVENIATEDVYSALFKDNPVSRKTKQSNIHPMDVQMVVFLCADHFLKQVMVTKLSECQYAIPLLVPNPFTKKTEFPLWTLSEIKRSWKTTDPSGKAISRDLHVYKAETPMVAFFRFDSVSLSKSQLMNNLINEKHNTFFHRHCPGSSNNRLLMEGVVEIAWYCPSGNSSDHFSECVAFCNLHGDSSNNQTQREIITQMASVNVVILSSLDGNDNNMAIVKKLCNSSTPLIVLLTDEDDDDAVSQFGQGKYRIRLKGRNQADVSAALRSVINDCLLQRPTMFNPENINKYSVVSVDEDNESCRKGKEAAQNIMRFLEGKEPSKIKETYLPCQGKLWHDWCQKSKELRRLQSNTEADVSKKQFEMKEIRWKQQGHGFTELMGLFVGALHSLSNSERIYFLQWTKIQLDELSSGKLSELREQYDRKWKKLLTLKRDHDKCPTSKTGDKLKAEQFNLEIISKKLNAATFGLEHILREVGQIYEASVSEKKNPTRTTFGDLSYLPTYAAELLISGHPMELMDGDTAYVPLIWISAVLDEVIRKLGDLRVFVLSVLGIQSSGKSTMLNAMFGLQFAVSAGRCTKGAFMQLVRVSEEMKKELRFDYILVIDTEGLRALELAGNNTIHHDNELSTFVVGLGNLTLVNIYGENPCEMQEILQIVVHAFLRMKQVRLNPSCIFVHQNVTDIAAKEKIMDGRIHLQAILDKMTKLAAKDELNYAENFSDVIAFDVEHDVKYFAQLWEGCPPMAPPNPRYSENIQELKREIISRASDTNGLKLSQFQKRVKDLWEALLDEDFVFSFKNAQEISVYRKLEQEYGKWAWSLRSAMLGIEDKMLNRVASGNVETIQREDLMKEMEQTLEDVQKAFNSYFDKDNEKETLIQWKFRFETQIQHLHDDLINDAKRKVDDSIQQRRLRKRLDEELKTYEKRLFEKSKELALKLKGNVDKESNAKAEFDSMWEGWVSELTRQAPIIKDVNTSKDVTDVLVELYGYDMAHKRNSYESIESLNEYNSYVPKRNSLFWRDPMSFLSGSVLKPEDNKSIRDLIFKTTEQTKTKVESFPFSAQGYNSHYIQEILRDVRTLVLNFESDLKRNRKMSEDVCVLNKAFYVDLSLYVFDQVKECIAELHRKYKEANDPVTYFEKKKPEYFNIFQKYWKGATSAAILGDQVCSKLKKQMVQSVYNRIAQVFCGQIREKEPFNGNRADLEKYILKSLAEQLGNKDEKFHKYLTYMYYPRTHFEGFIKDKVKEFMAAENSQAVSAIRGCIDHREKLVMGAAKLATARARQVNWDANKWLDFFSSSLADDLGDTRVQLCDEETKNSINYDVLVDVIKEKLSNVVEELKRNLSKLSDLRMEKFRERPDEILIKHFCRCCWEQCPFCGAVCTNSQKNHPGDHNADFHRTSGLNGLHHKDTTEFFIEFCTAAVASDNSFYPTSDCEISIPFKQYRMAGGKYANWLISTDLSELAYWKWFICEFQENLEKHQNKQFNGKGQIPDEWKHYTQLHAVESRDGNSIFIPPPACSPKRIKKPIPMVISDQGTRWDFAPTCTIDIGRPQAEPLDSLAVDIIIAQKADLGLKGILSSMKVSVEERKAIQVATVGQNTNPLWHTLRQGRLTASNFGAVLPALQKGRNVAPSTFNRLLDPKPLDNIPAIQWGRDNEKEGLKKFKALTQMSVKESGLWLSASGVLGASPDGLVGLSALLEVKCPYSVWDMTIEEAAKNKDFYLQKEGGIWQLQQTHTYWHQVQGQLHVTQRDICYFVVWTTKDFKIVKIPRDEAWQPNLQLLEQFYKDQMLPRILEKKNL
ncbi:interferon-induced very large GTPase 1-like [Trichomycterus rosablanca]|uniref:interferon-induced very large GTPase 1-like n=1 Tax=Trichomycterus rosablanca TaxID=2290929 RepID=UPI002F35B4B5